MKFKVFLMVGLLVGGSLQAMDAFDLLDMNMLIDPRVEYEVRIERVERGEDDVSSLNKWPDYGWCSSALRVLVQGKEKDLKLARRALKAGADSNYYDGVDTPLNGASTLAALNLLFDYKAEVEKMREPFLLHQVFLHYGGLYKYKPKEVSDDAWFNECREAMDVALGHGVDIDAIRGYEGHILQYILKEKERIPEPLVKELVEHVIWRGASLDFINSLSSRHKSAVEKGVPFMKDARWSQKKDTILSLQRHRLPNLAIRKIIDMAFSKK